MLARSVGKDRLPEATGEKHFPIKELATAVQASYLKKSPTTAVFRNRILVVFVWLWIHNWTSTCSKKQLGEGQKKMKKEEVRDNENLCSIILN